MKKRGFTLVEVLVASTIMGTILIASTSVMALITHMLYSGQTERQSRLSLSDNIYYLTREIQSAEEIKISADGKTLKIKQLGHSSYSIEYMIIDSYPTGELLFKDKKMLYIDYFQSKFEATHSNVKISLVVYKDNLNEHKISQKLELEISPRSKGARVQVED